MHPPEEIAFDDYRMIHCHKVMTKNQVRLRYYFISVQNTTGHSPILDQDPIRSDPDTQAAKQDKRRFRYQVTHQCLQWKCYALRRHVEAHKQKAPERKSLNDRKSRRVPVNHVHELIK